MTEGAPVTPEPWRRTLDEVKRAHIEEVLARVRGNRTEAAKILGIDRRTLYRFGYRAERKPRVDGD